MAGWTIVALHQAAGHIVTYLDTDTGAENLAGTFGPQVSVEEIIDIILVNAETADWMILPGGEVRIVSERSGDGG